MSTDRTKTTRGATRTRRVALACAAGVHFALALGCGLSGTEEPEPAAAGDEPMAPEQEAQILRYCQGHCESQQPQETQAWLRDICVSGCVTGRRIEWRAGTWQPPDESAPRDPLAGCPNSADCLNTCNRQCEATHGPSLDRAAADACHQRGGSPEECSRALTNRDHVQCFRACRGLPPL